MLRMIDTEIQELEMIQKELDNDAITISDIDNRYSLFINLTDVHSGLDTENTWELVSSSWLGTRRIHNRMEGKGNKKFLSCITSNRNFKNND